MSALRASFILGLLSLGLGLQGSSAANSWQTVIAGTHETIEIDKASIARAASGATAWSRIRLDRRVRDVSGAYDAIRAQNLYECTARRFTTLRRAYFDGETRVREDAVSRQRANLVEAGSIDERLFNVACGLAHSADALAPADSLGSAKITVPRGDQGERPEVMHADMRTLAADQTMPRLTPVADAAPVTAAEKPRLIILPPIDKAAADMAAAEQAVAAQKPGTGSAVATKAPGSAPDKSLAVSPAQRPVALGTASAGVRHKEEDSTEKQESSLEKRLRELHYATSGPRKATRKKKLVPMPEGEQDNPAAHMSSHWSYEGAGGADNWGRLRTDYAICGTGKRQSPIDIREGIKVDLEAIRFDYKPTQFRIIDTGHTVQVEVGAGMGLTVMGKRYELQQLHFHRPSEERVNGRAYDMVAHLVHKNDEGRLAVVAVLLEKGSEHPLIQTLWNNLPLEQSMDVTPEEVIDLNKLLPEGRTYWTYMGSLTTPPCTEGVLWMVMKQAVQVAPEQIAIFSQVYRNNARPVQAANGRLIKGSR